MEKRANAQIYMLVAEPKGKDDPELIDNSLYTPIQCGANDSKYDICELKDNKDSDNISNMNWMFFENTGSYYIAKHINNKKYIGQCSYRRRLIFDENFSFDTIFSNYDIILPKPYRWGKDMYNMYKGIHNIVDFENCLNIINELYPEYSNEVNLAKNNNLMLYYSSGFIMTSEDYKKYFNWLFSIFNEFIKRYNLTTIDDVIRHLVENKDLKNIKYNISICAFLQERLFSIYVEHNYPLNKRYHVDYDKVNCQADKKYNY